MSIDNAVPPDIIDIKQQMAQLIVRELEESVVRALKVRAAKKGVSAEAEHRAILREVLLSRSTGGPRPSHRVVHRVPVAGVRRAPPR